MRRLGSLVSRGHPGPWFRLHPRAAFSVAAMLFVVVTILRLAIGGTQESVSTLYVLPIALLAISFGVTAGVVAGIAGTGLIVLWALVSDASPGGLGVLSHATPLLLLGALVGVASDTLRQADDMERRAASIALLQREAAEIHDGIVQGLAVTKWTFEAGDVDRGLIMLEENLASAQQLVSRMLGADSVLPGDLRRSVPLDQIGEPFVVGSPADHR